MRLLYLQEFLRSHRSLCSAFLVSCFRFQAQCGLDVLFSGLNILPAHCLGGIEAFTVRVQVKVNFNVWINALLLSKHVLVIGQLKLITEEVCLWSLSGYSNDWSLSLNWIIADSTFRHSKYSCRWFLDGGRRIISPYLVLHRGKVIYV